MKISKKLTVIILSILVFLGSVLRLVKLTQVPAGLLQDEAAAGYDAYALLISGKDHHGAAFPITFQTFNDWTGHFFNYQLIPFIAVFGLNPFSIRFAVALLSILTIPLIYLLGKELTDDKFISLIMTFLFSFSQYSVNTSRWAVQPNTVVFFWVLALVLFLDGLNRKEKRRPKWILSGIIFGLTAYTYPSAEGFLPLFLLGCVIVILFSRKKSDSKLGFDLTIFVFVFLLLIIPLIIDHLKRPETILIKLGMVSVFSGRENFLVSYLNNYLSYYLPSYLFFGSEVNPTRAIPGFGYENASLAVFYYLGIFALILRSDYWVKKYPFFDKRKSYLLFWFLLIFPSIPSLTVPAGNFQRAIYIIPFLTFFISAGIVYFFHLLKQYQRKLRKSLVRIVLVLLLFIYIFQQIRFYLFYFGGKYKALCEWYFQYGLEEVVKYVSQRERNYANIIIDNTINQPYIYFLFYQKTDPKTLNYEDFSSIDPKTNWLAVKKYKNYKFERIEEEQIIDARLAKTIYNSPYSNYVIYEKGKDLIVDFQLKNSQ